MHLNIRLISPILLNVTLSKLAAFGLTKRTASLSTDCTIAPYIVVSHVQPCSGIGDIATASVAWHLPLKHLPSEWTLYERACRDSPAALVISEHGRPPLAPRLLISEHPRTTAVQRRDAGAERGGKEIRRMSHSLVRLFERLAAVARFVGCCWQSCETGQKLPLWATDLLSE